METSQNWLDSHIKKTKQHDTLRRLAQMRHQWRTAIQDFLDRRNHKEPTNLLWKLFSISLPRRMSRVPVFGHRHSDCLVKLTICRAEDVLSQEPSTSGRTSARPQTPSSHITTKPSVASLAVPKKDHPAHESKNTSKYHNGNESGKELIETKSDLQVPPNQSTTRRKRDDWISTVEIVEKRSRDNPLQVTGFTLIPTGLISASALRELDHPFTEDTANEISMVPSILRDEELMELIRVTIAQITDGQRKLLFLSSASFIIVANCTKPYQHGFQERWWCAGLELQKEPSSKKTITKSMWTFLESISARSCTKGRRRVSSRLSKGLSQGIGIVKQRMWRPVQSTQPQTGGIAHRAYIYRALLLITSRQSPSTTFHMLALILGVQPLTTEIWNSNRRIISSSIALAELPGSVLSIGHIHPRRHES